MHNKFSAVHGVGADIHHAAVISVEQEKRMWESGVLRLENPEALLRGVLLPEISGNLSNCTLNFLTAHFLETG